MESSSNAFGRMVAPPPDFTLPHASTLPKRVGNNYLDPAFGLHHSKRQILQVQQSTCREASAKDYNPGVTTRMTAPEPDGTVDSQTFQATLKAHSECKALLDTSAPKWLSLDDKILRFYAYIIEGTVRTLVITFYPHDNTLMVEEEKVQNSGIQGGKFLKRHRVETITLTDLNIGNELVLYGRKYTIYNCDEATRYFLDSIGIYVPDPFPVPLDGTATASYQFGVKSMKRGKTQADRDLKVSFEQQCKGRVMTQSADDVRKTQQFFADDGRVLMFRAIWDDRGNENGDLRQLELKFYLGDSTIEVIERLPPNSGRDPQRALVSRKRLPKDTRVQTESTLVTRGNAISEDDWYLPSDLYIGATVNLYGRTIHLVGCDLFTRSWYLDVAGVELAPDVDVNKAFNVVQRVHVKKPPPPHNGFGTEEDSLGNCKSLVLKPPKRILKPEELDGVVLRFQAVLNEGNSKVDFSRSFVIMYFMGDDTLQINEVSQRNSGLMGGRFLRRQRVRKESGDYIAWSDFTIGSPISIHSWKFLIESADAHTLKFLGEQA